MSDTDDDIPLWVPEKELSPVASAEPSIHGETSLDCFASSESESDLEKSTGSVVNDDKKRSPGEETEQNKKTKNKQTERISEQTDQKNLPKATKLGPSINTPADISQDMKPLTKTEADDTVLADQNGELFRAAKQYPDFNDNKLLLVLV